MHLVLLTGHYPPSKEVGSIRPEKVVRAFAARGHRVTVVRAPGSEPKSGESPTGDSAISIRTIHPGPSPRTWYRDLKEAFAASEVAVPDPVDDGTGDAWVPPENIGALKRLILSLMWLPDDQQGLILPLAKAAITAVREGGRDGLLYSTSPPHSVHVAGLIASAITGVPWIVEFRDPWSDNPAKPWFCRSALSEAAERWLERRCLARARAVVAVTEGIERVVRAKLGPRAGLVRLVRNGIDTMAANLPESRGGPFRIVHAGSFYLGRDPRPFLRSLHAMVTRRRLGPDDIVVEFIGRAEWFEGVSIPQVVEEMGLGSIVRFVPWLPHQEATEKMADADLLLLLAEGQPLQVPNKLYEYLGTRRRMLVYADPDGETAQMIRAVGGHLVVHSGDAGSEAALDRAFAERPAGPIGNVQLLQAWATEGQMNGLVDAIETLRPGGGLT